MDKIIVLFIILGINIPSIAQEKYYIRPKLIIPQLASPTSCMAPATQDPAAQGTQSETPDTDIDKLYIKFNHYQKILEDAQKNKHENSILLWLYNKQVQDSYCEYMNAKYDGKINFKPYENNTIIATTLILKADSWSDTNLRPWVSDSNDSIRQWQKMGFTEIRFRSSIPDEEQVYIIKNSKYIARIPSQVALDYSDALRIARSSFCNKINENYNAEGHFARVRSDEKARGGPCLVCIARGWSREGVDSTINDYETMKQIRQCGFRYIKFIYNDGFMTFEGYNLHYKVFAAFDLKPK